jgi:hypothetical protein
MIINKDFREFIELLNSNNVKYLVVGGYAVAFHGYPRYTKDMDIWIWINENNAKKLIKTLEEFGFSSLGLKKEDFLKPEYVIQLGYPPNRIDILTKISGLEFEKCYKSRVKTNMDGITIDFINLENLKKNKKAIGRFKDLADLENLE